MSELSQLVDRFLSLKKKEAPVKEEGLLVHNSFRALFETKEIEKDEVEALQNLFWEHASDEEEARGDFQELVRLTSELRAIQKQAILLVGERVFEVREIFRKYGEERGGFTLWLNYAFQARKTAYNALAFYELYQELPSQELKEKLKKMPAKASYILASREGESKVKWDLIQEYQGEKQKEMIARIEEKFPLRQGDKRSLKTPMQKKIDELEEVLEWLLKKSHHFSSKDRSRLKGVASLGSSLFSLVNDK